MPFSALFLDRDGVINTRLPGTYVTRPSEFQWMPGNPKAIARLRPYFDYLFVVTNQQGVGKGMMRAEDLEDIHRHLLTGIEQAGGQVDRIYACPDLKSKPGNCRKPNPSMGLQAKAEYPDIDFARSVMVGDSLSDLQFGQALGMRNVWMLGKREETPAIQQAVEQGLSIWRRVESLQALLPDIRSGY